MAGDWALNGQWNWVAGRNREAADARPQIKDYDTFDLTLTKGSHQSKWSLSAGVRNLFDSDAREPSLAPGSIPNDLPLPRRTWVAQLQYRL